MVDLSSLDSAASWSTARKEIAASVDKLLGKRPSKRSELQLTVLDEVDFPKYVRRRVNYFVDDWTRVSAWMFFPEGNEEAPGVLCCHQECRQGKDEPAGLEGNGRMALAAHYAEQGYVTLAPDCITAGERVSSRSEPYESTLFYRDYPDMSLLGKMLADHQHALDVFEMEDRVDAARIGVVGHGLGGTNALILAALDGRVQSCVASCGFSRFSTDSDVGRWASEGPINLLPGLQSAIDAGSFEFDWEHLLAMAAPSAIMVITAMAGAAVSNPESCAESVEQVGKLYKYFGAPRAIEHFSHDDGHDMTFETLDMADDWFERWL
jgi:dienelactone hydrolase